MQGAFIIFANIAINIFFLTIYLYVTSIVHKKHCLFVAAHLGIALAAKFGLYKLVLGIGLILASMKIILVMAWALAISKYVPDVWTSYQNTDHTKYQYEKFVENLEQKNRPGHSNLLLDLFSRHG